MTSKKAVGGEAKKPARKRNSVATREALLSAACRRFSENNFESVSLRDICGDVGVDVAMISRYFDSKENLFRTVIKTLLDPTPVLSLDKTQFGSLAAQSILEADAEHRLDLLPMLVLFRSATSETALPILQEVVHDHYVVPISQWLGGEASEIRTNFLTFLIGGAVFYFNTSLPEERSGPMKDIYGEMIGRMLQQLVDGPPPAAKAKRAPKAAANPKAKPDTPRSRKKATPPPT